MIAHDYIWARLKEDDLVLEAGQYLTDMHYEKVRICVDGFPDARSPKTNGYSVRLKINSYREMHKSYMHNKFKHSSIIPNAYNCGYKDGYDKALDDVIEPILSAESKTKDWTVTQHIANLRKLLNRN